MQGQYKGFSAVLSAKSTNRVLVWCYAQDVKTTQPGLWRINEPEGNEDEVEMVNKNCSSGEDCPVCCYHILSQYNLLTDTYHILGLAYRFLLTLSVTQVMSGASLL